MRIFLSRIVRQFLLVAGLGILSLSQAQGAGVVLDAQTQLGFATRLMHKGEFEAAAGEFERFMYYFPKDPGFPLARELKGLCLLEAGRYEKARGVFLEILENAPRPERAAKALFLMGESYYRQGVQEEAARYFRRLVRDHPESDLAHAALYRLGWTSLRRDLWDEASRYFRLASPGQEDFLNSRTLAEKSLEGKALPSKSPSVAGGLAAVLPGLGHVYTGRYRDAVVSFLVNGLFIWAAVESFHEDQEVLGGMLLFLEAGWYTGNIHSAVGAAHKYNRRVRKRYREGLQDRLRLGLTPLGKGKVGLGFIYRFQ